MNVKGTVNIITDPTAFFLPVVLGGAPSAGYGATDSPVTVILILGGAIFPFFSSTFSTVVNTADGSFAFDLPDSLVFMFTTVSVRVTYYGLPYYRSATFPLVNAGRQELNIWIYEAELNLPPGFGVTAGQLSTALAGSSLPGNTSLSVSQNGFSISGTQSQVSLQFGLLVVPDTSANLSVFFDLELNGYNISVGWPEDWCESADDVLNSIKSGLQNEGSTVNTMALNEIQTALQSAPLNLSMSLAQTFISLVSVQFIYVSYPNKHTWSLSAKTDKTIVMVPQPCIGYPRAWL